MYNEYHCIILGIMMGVHLSQAITGRFLYFLPRHSDTIFSNKTMRISRCSISFHQSNVVCPNVHSWDLVAVWNFKSSKTKIEINKKRWLITIKYFHLFCPLNALNLSWRPCFTDSSKIRSIAAYDILKRSVLVRLKALARYKYSSVSVVLKIPLSSVQIHSGWFLLNNSPKWWVS